MSAIKPKRKRPIKQFFALIKRYFRKIIFVVNIFAVLALLLAYLSAYISPIDFYLFAFLGLSYSFLLLANLLFIIFWAILKSKRFLISLTAILLGWSFLTSFLQISFNKKEFDVNEQEVKVLTYNVRVFDRWNWSSEKNRGMKTISYIKKAKSNIVCLQEFYSNSSNGRNTIDSIKSGSGLKYSHISFASKKRRKYHHGIATFSSYPIVGKGKVKSHTDENFCIYSDIKIDEDTIRVYNLHLESIHLGYADYDVIENINKNDTLDVRGIRSILTKLRKGYQKRTRQANVISAHIAKSKFPVLVCGDFNDTPVSYVYQRLTENLIDAFCVSGNGIGSTYINKFSTFRIDYILHSSQINSFNHSTPKIELSDHYPVKCSIQLSKQ